MVFRQSFSPGGSEQLDVLIRDGLPPIGTLMQDVDGYHYFWPAEEEGAWSQHMLREIADKMRDLDAAWDEQVRREL